MSGRAFIVDEETLLAREERIQERELLAAAPARAGARRSSGLQEEEGTTMREAGNAGQGDSGQGEGPETTGVPSPPRRRRRRRRARRGGQVLGELAVLLLLFAGADR